jgi:nucleoside-diphosphate-sugar epimerase
VVKRFCVFAADSGVGVNCKKRSQSAIALCKHVYSKIILYRLKTPNGVCAITDSEGNSWGLLFTDVRDTVDGIIRVLESKDAVGQAFNLVGPAAVPFTTVAKLIAANTTLPYLEVKMPFLWWFNISNAKARSILGYEPKYTYPDMVASALAFRRGEDIGVVPV